MINIAIIGTMAKAAIPIRRPQVSAANPIISDPTTQPKLPVAISNEYIEVPPCGKRWLISASKFIIYPCN